MWRAVSLTRGYAVASNMASASTPASCWGEALAVILLCQPRQKLTLSSAYLQAPTSQVQSYFTQHCTSSVRFEAWQTHWT